MTLLEAIEARHSVRKYTDEPISGEILSILREKIEEVNREAGLHVQLVTDEPKAFKGLMAYGAFSGAKNYFVMAGKKCDDLDEKIGYYGEMLVLLAQTLGLNTCWAGASYTKIPGTYVLEDDEKIGCYIALGYGQTQGTSHKVKQVRDISNASDVTPKWFKKGVDAALLAPTAVNQQKFFIEYVGFKDFSKVPKVAARPVFSMIGYSKMDLGIVKYHFELGAGKENFEWM
ncbi:MAG: nitroreductase [Bacteroidaceae bacterium]|nr:nitroreductase [Bacteroidaceae bacterium]